MTTGSRCCALRGAILVSMCLALVAALVSTVAIGAGAAPPALQPYEDPDKLFAIGYPQGWHVKRFPSGVTLFYLDDPEEGTGVNYRPAGTLKGEMDASQAPKVFATDVRKKYSDFRIVGQEQRPMRGNSNGTIVDAAAVWTNVKKVPMKGWGSLGAIKQVGKGTTLFSYMGYQVPAKGFDKVEPVFDRITSR